MCLISLCLALIKDTVLNFGSLVAQTVKNLPEDVGLISGLGRSLEKEMATLSNILAWEIPWTEKPGGLLSMGLQRVDKWT